MSRFNKFPPCCSRCSGFDYSTGIHFCDLLRLDMRQVYTLNDVLFHHNPITRSDLLTAVLNRNSIDPFFLHIMATNINSMIYEDDFKAFLFDLFFDGVYQLFRRPTGIDDFSFMPNLFSDSDEEVSDEEGGYEGDDEEETQSEEEDGEDMSVSDNSCGDMDV